MRSYHPFPYAIRIANSSDIRFRNVHIDNNSSIASCDEHGENCRQLVRAGKVSFANAIVDQTRHIEVRDREFAWLDINDKPAPAEQQKRSPVLEPGASVQKVSDGFFNLSGGTADAAGNLYFVDSYWQRIYKWEPKTRALTIVRDNPLDPVNITFDKSGNLIVVSSGGMTETVYSFRPDAPEQQLTILERQPAAPVPRYGPGDSRRLLGQWRLQQHPRHGDVRIRHTRPDVSYQDVNSQAVPVCVDRRLRLHPGERSLCPRRASTSAVNGPTS